MQENFCQEKSGSAERLIHPAGQVLCPSGRTIKPRSVPTLACRLAGAQTPTACPERSRRVDSLG